MYRYLVAASAVFFTACAASGPPSNGSASMVAGTPTTTGPQAAQSTEPTESALEEEGIQVVEVPGVAQPTPATGQATSAALNEVVCRREIPTGSRLATRVCRTRSQIEARQEADKEWLDEKQTDGLTGSGGSAF